LSLAITGWLLGAVSSESSPDHAVRLWRTRQMVLDYQRTRSIDERKKMLAAYLKDKTATVPLDEIAQMVPHLPPPEPPERIDTKPVEKTIGAGRGAINYLLQVPPEYTPGRSYPLVILLCNSGDKPEDIFKRWSAMGSENGYFLAAPTWEGGALGRGGYGFSVREHATVLETIRELRRHYQIDSDRVFLYGLGQGGLMALDVGLSHPDLFAGVMTMGALPELYAERYFRNAEHLPLYLVTGTRSGDVKRLRTVVEAWVTRGYPTLWVEYKGRGPEWFGAELPNLFDWMRGKRREFPLRQLGSDGLGGPLGKEFTSLRKTDNRFYWLSSDGILDQHTVDPGRWNGRVQPATFVGRINRAENEIYLTVKGMKTVSLWLGRTAKGENMIDWDKPLKVTVNLTALRPRKVEMSLETLLEDLYERGDKQQLFLARLDYKLTR
jgi:pimeloyl-ACP methyl ester carboxylesterase